MGLTRNDVLKTEYYRNLPHLQYIGATFFITFRLKGSLPASVTQQLMAEQDQVIASLKQTATHDVLDEVPKAQKRYFSKIERVLDACQYGPDWLRNPAIAELVATRLHEAADKLYNLLAYCIMPNHVHLVVDTAAQLDNLNPNDVISDKNFQQLYRTLGVIKGGSGFDANRLLKHKGPFWQPESYDHYVRSYQELINCVNYVLQNPVKAGLVDEWQDWPYSYLSEPTHGPRSALARLKQ